MKDVEVVISDQTAPISQAGFGLPLVFDPNKDINYTEVLGTAYIPSPLASTDPAYKMIARMLEQEPSPSKVAVFGVDVATAMSTITDELNKMAVEHNDFYFLLLASRTKAEIEETAAWAGANKKLYITQNDTAETVTNITNMAGNIASSRVGIFAHDGGIAAEDPYVDAAIVGRIAPLLPGAVTWKFKKCNGVPVASFVNADVSLLHSANVNTYVKKMGVLQTSEGKATDGSYLDIQRSKDWLSAKIEEEIFALLVNSEKIPYDDTGIAQVVSKLKSVLKLAVKRGVIAKDENGNGMWSVNIPRRADIPANTIANRILPDINFTAYVAGAVHNVLVNGVLKV